MMSAIALPLRKLSLIASGSSLGVCTRTNLLQRETTERWWALCEQAAVEQDPDRLLLLVREIDQLLNEKQERLKQKRSKSENGS